MSISCRTVGPTMRAGPATTDVQTSIGAGRWTSGPADRAVRAWLRAAREVVAELPDDQRLQLALIGSTALLVVEAPANLPFVILAFVLKHFGRAPAIRPVAAFRSPNLCSRRSGGWRGLRSDLGHEDPGRAWPGRRHRRGWPLGRCADHNQQRWCPQHLWAPAPGESRGEIRLPRSAQRGQRCLQLRCAVRRLGRKLDRIGPAKYNVLVLEDDDCDRFYRLTRGSETWVTSGLSSPRRRKIRLDWTGIPDARPAK